MIYIDSASQAIGLGNWIGRSGPENPISTIFTSGLKQIATRFVPVKGANLCTETKPRFRRTRRTSQTFV